MIPSAQCMGYHVFVDESGQKEYIDPYARGNLHSPERLTRDFWLRNYFVITGLVVRDGDIPAINAAMMQLKRDAFGDPSVEVKSDWLRNPYQRRAHYLNKYGIDEATLNRFGFAVSALFPKFAEQIKIVACVFDKRYYRDRVSNDPCCNSCQVVLERIEFYMRRLSSQCILVVDQMESSLSAERGKNGELRDVLLNRRRMKHTFIERYRRIRDISFRESKHENLIQLADLAAYDVFRQFVDYGRDWENTSNDTLQTYPYFNGLAGNFLDRNGRIRGIGICKLPDTAKINWIPGKK